MPVSTVAPALPTEAPPVLARGAGIVHASRTLMLHDLARLFEVVPAGAPADAYHHAIVEDNALLKPTLGTRARSLKYLRQLYGLEDRFGPFGPLRRLWAEDAASRPLLAAVTGLLRDGLFRASADLVLSQLAGEPVGPQDLSRAIRDGYRGRLTEKTLASAGRNAASSWTQTGYLIGLKDKVRARVTPTPAATAYAMLIGHLTGARGLRLFETPFARLLDAPAGQLDELAFAASQRGWLEYRRIGDVAEFGFAGLLGAGGEGRVEG